MQGVRHTQCREVSPSIGGLGVISFPGAQQILHIFGDSTYIGAADGTMRKPFMTIGAAVTAANALTPAVDNRVLLLVWPKEGGYDEAVTLADDYVYMAGVSRDGVILTTAAAIVLTVTTQHTAVWNMTVVSTKGASPGSVIEVTAPGAAWTEPCSFYECVFISSAANVLMGIRASTRASFKDCRIEGVGAGSIVGQFVGLSVILDGCAVDTRIQVFGGCVFTLLHSDTAGINGPVSSASFFLHNSILHNDGTTAPVDLSVAPTDLVVQGCHFVNATGISYDISSVAAITGAIIENNVMVKGIDPDISHVNPNKRVGEAAVKDWYATVQDALDACTYDDCVVTMYQDETLAGGLTWNKILTVTVDGRSINAINYGAGQILGLGGGGYSNRHFTFRRITLTGVIIFSVSDGFLQSLTLDRCEMSGAVACGSGTLGTVKIVSSTIRGNNGANVYWPLRFYSDTDSTVVVENSFLKGYSTYPAVYWAGVTNNNLKAKHSTFVHGSAGANNPFDASAAQTPNFRAHHCGFNADPTSFAGPPNWTNLIAAGQQQNTYDVNVDWS